MTTKIIPEKRIYICDVCLRENAIHRMNAQFTIKRSALDWQGSACADATTNFDACDECHNRLADVINRETTIIQEEKK